MTTKEEGKILKKEVQGIQIAADKYRSILLEEVENTKWRHGGPPIFDAVNKLFEDGRTKVSIEPFINFLFSLCISCHNLFSYV